MSERTHLCPTCGDPMRGTTRGYLCSDAFHVPMPTNDTPAPREPRREQTIADKFEAYQRAGFVHPFTCGGRRGSCSGVSMVLKIASGKGLIIVCPTCEEEQRIVPHSSLWNIIDSFNPASDPFAAFRDAAPAPRVVEGEPHRCPTCGEAKYGSPRAYLCSDGFHAEHETYWPIPAAADDLAMFRALANNWTIDFGELQVWAAEHVTRLSAPAVPALPEGQEAPRMIYGPDAASFNEVFGVPAPDAPRASPEGRDTGGGMTPREDEGDDGPEPWNDAANALEWEADRASEEADEMAEMQMVGRDYKALRDKAFDYRALAKCLRLASPLPAGGAEPDDSGLLEWAATLFDDYDVCCDNSGCSGCDGGSSSECAALQVEVKRAADRLRTLSARLTRSPRPDRKDADGR